MGRKNIKGKNRELTDFSYLLNKNEEKNDSNKIEKDDEKKD